MLWKRELLAQAGRTQKLVFVINNRLADSAYLTWRAQSCRITAEQAGAVQVDVGQE